MSPQSASPAPGRGPSRHDRSAEIFQQQREPRPEGRIDEIVFAHWERLGIRPARPCSDAVFPRRVYLDVIGTLPSVDETRQFLADDTPGKRALLIERLLERPERVDYWTMKWSDALRIKAEFPINLWPNAVQAYHRWVRAAMADNMPFDRFARELLTSSGSNFRAPQVNFYRALQGRDPKSIARAVALTFLGSRLESWPADRQEGFALFFSQIGYKSTVEWKEEIVFWDPSKAPADGLPLNAMFPDGTAIEVPSDRDPRSVFVDWLVGPGHRRLAEALANRVWSWLLGRGIVHEPDDMRPDNPPSIPGLLTYLGEQLVASSYDVRALFRVILNSQTYQLASIPRSDHPEREACFASYAPRRLEAEVLIDAICQITGTTEAYSSLIPEPFSFIPEDQRSIALADGSVSSQFLELFGRPARDTGLDAERNNQPSASQRLHMLNSSHIQRKLDQGSRLTAMTSATRSTAEAVTILYLAILSREPTSEEVAVAEAYAKSAGVPPRQAASDVAWALINSAEFHYRH